MKPEYWKETGLYFYYKVLSKKDGYWKILDVSQGEIAICYHLKNRIVSTSKPCSEAVFLKRYNQALKKIEKAVAK